MPSDKERRDGIVSCAEPTPNGRGLEVDLRFTFRMDGSSAIRPVAEGMSKHTLNNNSDYEMVRQIMHIMEKMRKRVSADGVVLAETAHSSLIHHPPHEAA